MLRVDTVYELWVTVKIILGEEKYLANYNIMTIVTKVQPLVKLILLPLLPSLPIAPSFLL